MKLKSGFKKLDSLLGGGLPDDTVTLLSGGPGTGKTLFGLKFIMEGLKAGEKCCYISLSETKEELLRAAGNIESLREIGKYVGKSFAIEHVTLGDNMTMRKFNEVISYYPMIDRLVIDSVNKLLIFAEDKRTYRIQLFELLKRIKLVSRCTLLICETKDNDIDSGNGESFECDGIIHLSFSELEEKPRRMLEIYKLRYTSFEPRVPHEFGISGKDIRVTGTRVI